MTIQTEYLSEALEQKRILVVEDDPVISAELANLFGTYTAHRPVIAGWVDEAERLVREADVSFDLSILDVMLPQTKQEYDQVTKYRVDLDHIRDSMRALHAVPTDESKAELRKLRQHRAQLLDLSSSCIHDRGGIDLARRWRASSESRMQFPILFLTCIGEKPSVVEGLSLQGSRTNWIVKPAVTEDILKECLLLLTATGMPPREAGA